MKIRIFIITSFAALLALGTHSVYASVEMDAYLPINGEPVTPSFTFYRTITLDYPNGGKLKDALDGKNFTFGFGGDSKDPTVKSFMDQLNTEIGKKSSVVITHLTADYHVLVHGDSKQASFDYTLTLRPTITGYILNKGIYGSPTVIDASWIGFDLKEPVVLLESSETEINYPENSIKNVFPDVYNVIHGTDAEDVLNKNLIDSSELYSMPLDRWDSLFDPAYAPTDIADTLSNGQKVAVTTFSTNPSAFSEKIPKTTDVDFTSDVKYHLSVLDRVNSGTVNIEGHAITYFIQGEPAFSTVTHLTSQNPCLGCPAIIWYEEPFFTWIWIGIAVASFVSGIFFFTRFRRRK